MYTMLAIDRLFCARYLLQCILITSERPCQRWMSRNT